MALDKAIEHGKEKRKPYRKRCEQVDKTCRPHGGCPHCESNRLHNRVKKETHAKMDIEETKFEYKSTLSTEELIEKFIHVGWWAYKKNNRNTIEGRKLNRHEPVILDGVEFTHWRELAIYKVAEFLQENLPDANIEVSLDGNDSTLYIEIDDNEQETLNKDLTDLFARWHLSI